MMKKRRIPFAWLPASWGLKGKTRRIAEAEYYHEGEALERMLIDIEHPDDQKKRDILNLRVALKYHVIDQYLHDLTLCEIEIDKDDEQALKVAKLAIELKHGKITQQQFNRQTADLKEEPYIEIIKSDYDSQLGVNGLYFEFDWNDLWIEYLRLNGYYGVNDEQVVEQWFADLCRTVAAEVPPPDREANVPFNSGRIINRLKRGDGTIYS
jgi:hypothetical protein